MKRRLLSLCAVLCMALVVMAEGKAKYVFYFIGDGMGVNQVNGTETYMAAVEGRIGTSPLCFAQFPYVGLVTTYSGTNGVTDSAAGGTALATGNKTKNGALGVKADLTTRINSIAALAKSEGKAVGVTTSVSVDHATPASFYAHVKDRNMYHQIGKDLIAAGFDFYAGSDFLQPENSELSGNKNLYTQCREAGYTIARGYADYRKKAKKAGKMLLLQTETASKADRTSIPYAIDRQKNDLALQDITRAAIHFLSQKDTDGFFLMVEGGKIDWACHSNDAATVFHEVMDMDNAIKVAYEFYEQHPDETLIVVTADHETGGIVLGKGPYTLNLQALKSQKVSESGYTKIVNELRKKYKNQVPWEVIKQSLKDNFGFWDSIQLNEKQEASLKKVYDESFSGKEIDLTKSEYQQDEPLAAEAKRILDDIALVGWTSGGHSGGYVPVFAIGAGAQLFQGRIDNTEIPVKIAEAAGYPNN